MTSSFPSRTVIAVVGPTGSGKTALSIELSRRLDGEVICCDSRTIYKYMDIGTAKPTMEERQGIEHHMLDIIEPDQVYTAGQYKKDAGEILEGLFARGKVPVVCGGTGFYARALLEGLSIPAVPPDEELRENLKELAEKEGNEVLLTRLEALDPVSAKKIGINDRFRLIRAIEVSIALDMPFSQATTMEPVPFDVLWIGLDYDDRAVLRSRIEKRLAEQIEIGLEEECRMLYERYGPTRTLVNAVTYKQFIEYFEGRFTYDQAVEDCVRHNYQLARKQLIWFRANEHMHWLKVDSPSGILSQALELVG
ncbi:MAG: tRNA (adenosine(37)-N6)-dimethylallyltransferase MiaA [Cyanobacteria bacterium HKST-UBA02]|nr:tRNA (adenosine(37)-N6)-dimethylallyltransferase MiaA [Cyanobacteria bacterium HKST-UBA02]